MTNNIKINSHNGKHEGNAHTRDKKAPMDDENMSHGDNPVGKKTSPNPNTDTDPMTVGSRDSERKRSSS